jgi:hypothetical protein
MALFSNRWVVAAGIKLPEPKVVEDIREMTFDEMLRFMGCKKTSYGSLKPLIVLTESCGLGVW